MQKRSSLSMTMKMHTSPKPRPQAADLFSVNVPKQHSDIPLMQPPYSHMKFVSARWADRTSPDLT